MAGVRLATGYIEISAETSKVPQQIQDALNKAGTQAAPPVGKQIGRDLAINIHEGLRTAPAPTGGGGILQDVIQGKTTIGPNVRAQGQKIGKEVATGINQGMTQTTPSTKVDDWIVKGGKPKDTGEKIGKEVKEGIDKGMADAGEHPTQIIKDAVKDFGKEITDSIKAGDVEHAFNRVSDVVKNTTTAIDTIGSVVGVNLDSVRDFGTKTTTTIDHIGHNVQTWADSLKGITDDFKNLASGDTASKLSALGGVADKLGKLGGVDVSGITGPIDALAGKATEIQTLTSSLEGLGKIGKISIYIALIVEGLDDIKKASDWLHEHMDPTKPGSNAAKAHGWMEDVGLIPKRGGPGEPPQPNVPTIGIQGGPGSGLVPEGALVKPPETPPGAPPPRKPTERLKDWAPWLSPIFDYGSGGGEAPPKEALTPPPPGRVFNPATGTYGPAPAAPAPSTTAGAVNVHATSAAVSIGSASINVSGIGGVTGGGYTPTTALPTGVHLGGSLGRQSGGDIPGSGAVPILAHGGEHMFTAGDVQAMGGHDAVYDFRNALHFDNGGPVGAPPPPPPRLTPEQRRRLWQQMQPNRGVIKGFQDGGEISDDDYWNMTPEQRAQLPGSPEMEAAKGYLKAHEEQIEKAPLSWWASSTGGKFNPQVLLDPSIAKGKGTGTFYSGLNQDWNRLDRTFNPATGTWETRRHFQDGGEIPKGTPDFLQRAADRAGMTPDQYTAAMSVAQPGQDVAGTSQTDLQKGMFDQSAGKPIGDLAESGRTGGFVPSGAGSKAVAGTSFVAGLLNLGNEAVAGLIDTGAQAASMAAAAGSFGMGGQAAGPLIQLGAGEAKRATSYGFQMASILADSLIDQVFGPFGGPPRWLGYDYTQFVPSMDIGKIGTTTVEKAMQAQQQGGKQAGPDQQPGGPVTPEHLGGAQPVGPPVPKYGEPAAPTPLGGGIPGQKPPGDQAGPGAFAGATQTGPGAPPPGPAQMQTSPAPPADKGPAQGIMDALGVNLGSFDEGGWLMPNTPAINTTGRPELVLSPSQVEQMQKTSANPYARGGDTYHITAVDAEDVGRQIDKRKKLAAMQYGGRP